MIESRRRCKPSMDDSFFPPVSTRNSMEYPLERMISLSEKAPHTKSRLTNMADVSDIVENKLNLTNVVEKAKRCFLDHTRESDRTFMESRLRLPVIVEKASTAFGSALVGSSLASFCRATQPAVSSCM